MKTEIQKFGLLLVLVCCLKFLGQSVSQDFDEPTTDSTGSSCSGFCNSFATDGRAGPEGCFCDCVCVKNGDCCEDACTLCGQCGSNGDDSWTLVFRQTYPTISDQWESYGLSPEEDNYSILDKLENFRDYNGNFLFKLVWPGSFDGANIWYQSSNPLNSTEIVYGYEEVENSYPKRFYGLAKSLQEEALLDGSHDPDINDWWFAVGVVEDLQGIGGLVGPFVRGDDGEFLYASQVELYVGAGYITVLLPDGETAYNPGDLVQINFIGSGLMSTYVEVWLINHHQSISSYLGDCGVPGCNVSLNTTLPIDSNYHMELYDQCDWSTHMRTNSFTIEAFTITQPKKNSIYYTGGILDIVWSYNALHTTTVSIILMRNNSIAQTIVSFYSVSTKNYQFFLDYELADANDYAVKIISDSDSIGDSYGLTEPFVIRGLCPKDFYCPEAETKVQCFATKFESCPYTNMTQPIYCNTREENGNKGCFSDGYNAYTGKDNKGSLQSCSYDESLEEYICICNGLWRGERCTERQNLRVSYALGFISFMLCLLLLGPCLCFDGIYFFSGRTSKKLILPFVEKLKKKVEQQNKMLNNLPEIQTSRRGIYLARLRSDKDIQADAYVFKTHKQRISGQDNQMHQVEEENINIQQVEAAEKEGKMDQFPLKPKFCKSFSSLDSTYEDSDEDIEADACGIKKYEQKFSEQDNQGYQTEEENTIIQQDETTEKERKKDQILLAPKFCKSFSNLDFTSEDSDKMVQTDNNYQTHLPPMFSAPLSLDSFSETTDKMVQTDNDYQTHLPPMFSAPLSLDSFSEITDLEHKEQEEERLDKSIDATVHKVVVTRSSFIFKKSKSTFYITSSADLAHEVAVAEGLYHKQTKVQEENDDALSPGMDGAEFYQEQKAKTSGFFKARSMSIWRILGFECLCNMIVAFFGFFILLMSVYIMELTKLLANIFLIVNGFYRQYEDFANLVDDAMQDVKEQFERFLFYAPLQRCFSIVYEALLNFVKQFDITHLLKGLDVTCSGSQANTKLLANIVVVLVVALMYQTNMLPFFRISTDIYTQKMKMQLKHNSKVPIFLIALIAQVPYFLIFVFKYIIQLLASLTTIYDFWPYHKSSRLCENTDYVLATLSSMLSWVVLICCIHVLWRTFVWGIPQNVKFHVCRVQRYFSPCLRKWCLFSKIKHLEQLHEQEDTDKKVYTVTTSSNEINNADEMPSLAEISALVIEEAKHFKLSTLKDAVYVFGWKFKQFLKMTFGVWDTLLIKNMEIHNLSQAFHVDDETNQEKHHQNTIILVGESRSLLWQFVPLFVSFAKFAEAANGPPVFISKFGNLQIEPLLCQEDGNFNSIFRGRLVQWITNMAQFTIMMFLAFWPSRNLFFYYCLVSVPVNTIRVIYWMKEYVFLSV